MKTVAREEIEELAHFIAGVWFKDQCRNPYASFYLWYREARDGERISLPIVSTDAPNDDYKLATPERISGAMTKEQVGRKIADCMMRLPILSAE